MGDIQLHNERSPLISTTSSVEEEAEWYKIYLEDAKDTFKLAVPIFISRVSYVGMKTTDTALLGHVSGHALSAAALSDLFCMCTGVLIQGRVLSIIVGQSIGAGNNQLAYVYFRISFLLLGALSVLVMISWCYTEQVWVWLGQPADISKDAGYYSLVFMLSIPSQLGFGQLSQFLSAQRIMKPEVSASLTALVCNLLLGLVLVLGIPIPGFSGFGFKACPIVTVVVVWCQCILLYYFFWNWYDDSTTTTLKAHESSSTAIGQLSTCILYWTDGITKDRIRTFSVLYFPAALALSSDFWRMGVIGAIAATIGETEVGIFNASYRILWISLIFVGSLSGAAGIKIAIHLGKGNALAARQAAAVGVGLALIFLITLSSLVYYNSRLFGKLFTDDESYLDLFEECRLPFTCVLFFMNLSVGIETIPLSMGQTGNIFYAGFIASWFGQVPFVVLLTHIWHDLYAIYSGVAIGYCVLTFIYSYLAFSSDYQKYSDIARVRTEQQRA